MTLRAIDHARSGSSIIYKLARSPRKSITSTRSFASSATRWQITHSTDVLIVGSGGAGLSAALRCHMHGLRPLVIEKSDKLGGTTAWSGGGLWVPNNEQHKSRGVQDSEEQALEYLNALIGDVGPASTPERRLAYVRNASKVVDQLSSMGCRWVPTVGMPDYHSDLPGALEDGRSIEPALVNAKELGAWKDFLRPPSIFAGPPMHIYEGIVAAKITSWSGISMLLKILVRWLGHRVMGRDPVALGQALITHLLKANRDRDTEIWRSTVMQSLSLDESGAVTGAIVVRDGEDVRVDAKSIVLSAGGFAKNDEMRRKYHQQPTDAAWSSVTPNDTGEVIQAGIDIGAATALMSEAWWNPTFLNPVNGAPWISFGERGRPGTIIVDSEGKRFLNEAESYNDAGRRFYERDGTAPAIPAWMVMDSKFAKRNPLSLIGPRFRKKDSLRTHFLHEAKTLEELSQKINVDTRNLLATVQRFNGFAKNGRDEDFGRGGTAMDRLAGDAAAAAGPNPNLGTLEKAPFYAIRIYPGDIGTKGGLLTDEHARVLNERGEAIPGLYAAGNTSASVMGRHYAGAGATIGPAVVFAALAVDHAAGSPWKA
ncbi:uncharacterized protein HMPREF1541_10335 [Cyphellophora europaea CBS 101466]|uniref:FAD-dependent oxidoreductase 2 FAD-binding domain-containing protein n=1 Tax=Cyphellophora europaea (strain CBS 101466) TaxID=1220924 RepID=W2S7Q6_CYPE1|nr:uncharacterized protein HMPREF1541_10335 [Cyphellophora europaea CBS 101466]ETN44665.1 hypothetical protein HMPREF1541_10335 [Cyphellophora europaea CBS 101466]